MTRPKFHMCLQLADLPKPDRKVDQSVYGAFYTKDAFRYYPPARRLTAPSVFGAGMATFWKQLNTTQATVSSSKLIGLLALSPRCRSLQHLSIRAQHLSLQNRHRPVSMTPQPRLTGSIPQMNRAPPLSRMSRGSRASSQMVPQIVSIISWLRRD